VGDGEQLNCLSIQEPQILNFIQDIIIADVKIGISLADISNV